MAPSKLLEDDFILTLSDREDLPLSDENLSAEEADAPPEKFGPSKKRKRVGDKDTSEKKSKKSKQGGLKGQHQKPVQEDVDSSSSEQEQTEGKIDDSINPDFEFDIGGNLSTGVIEDFDGWGEVPGPKQAKQANGNKKSVDIDELIARRAAKKANGPVAGPAAGNGDEERIEDIESIQDSDDAEEGKFPTFDDEELLAPDVFGAGADPDEEDEAENSEEDSDLDSGSESEGELNLDSDDESVASPTAHPDDVLNDSDDDQSSASDTEEAAKRAAFFAPESKSTTTSSTNSFTSFSLSRPILKALSSLSFTAPTPIQTRSIPLALAGHDLVGSAVTGSGKTAAFLLPILERLLYRPRRIPTTRVVILVPTRELAVQCHAVAIQLAKFTDITFALVVGGFSLREQEAVLKKRPDVVIATPGRFIDHMRNSVSFVVESIEILVLDEADRMLEDGFADELDEILKSIPRSRQTMLFSATMTEQVDKLVRVGMNKPVRVSVDKKKSTTGGLIQEFVRLRPGREGYRLATLAVLCKQFFTERTIVFFRQKKEAHRIRVIFALLGIKAGELHGSMTQEQRIGAVESFRDGRTTHLLATDLASRGLDIKNVQNVVNFEAPQSHEIYLHRVGRTARAGREGRACTIAAEPDRKVVKAAVKSARNQGAKVASRVLDGATVDAMKNRIDGLEQDIEAILEDEKEEKQLAQAETQITRGENLVKYGAEIAARPRRTWFESEKEKKRAKEKGRDELNGPKSGVVAKIGKKDGKLSGKDRKRLDDYRERTEGKVWRKGKGSEDAVKRERKEGKEKKKSKTMGKVMGGGRGGGFRAKGRGGKMKGRAKGKR